ncbi:outer membrane protein OmpA-like peptidoglycan-associated protein [Mycolicibacterium sp. BK556]|uniref:OmpA family protein n=1 Tax=unclassified Mycolicibacterium TaxID=2636767 RepID=UPI00160A6DE6|nr:MULTISPECIES: OmpA family protein [unclassified Mycolicibacterium]MBB3602770.1 outer membrane protein OmpA-like peptidoglycan-associated protein [Mycolicibacterium sp. BK556]MBB3632965.1 outer membrane protein OmpA-like peptidoglycan-associated protein [Mycolicibacterium sp. BK607]
MNMSLAKLAVSGVVITTTALMGTGCSDAAATDAAASSKDICNQAPVLEKSTPTVAVLAEVGSTTDYYVGDLETMISGAKQMRARVLINGVGAGIDAPSLVTNVALVGDGNNKMQREKNLECKETLIRNSFRGTLHSLPDPKPLDVFGALRTIGGNLESTPTDSEIDVVIFSSALSSAAPVNLNDPAVLANPGIALNQIAAQQLLPKCARWRVYVVGGDQHTDPTLSATTAAQLREFWREYFERCGGQLVAWSPHLDTFPTTNGAIAAADTSQIPVRHEDGVTIAELNDDVLFDAGRDNLRQDAASELEQVLTLANQAHGEIVIDGFTDVGGDEADNVGLSERRCATIEAWLVQRGVDGARISHRGHGSADAKYPNPTTPEEHQANRRVEISIFG